MLKKFYSSHRVLKNGIFSFFFSTVKMAAKYAHIDKVGSFEAGFQQIPLV